MSLLGDNHRRVVAVHIAYISDLLADVERAGAATRAPFAKLIPDLGPAQQRAILESVARLRRRLQSALLTLGLAEPAATTPASWAAGNALEFADIAVDEMAPARLRGYGELSSEGTAALESVNADLKQGLRQLRVYLSRDPAANIAERLARLDASDVDVGRIRALERIIDAHGMLELLPTLQSILEKLEIPSFDIAIFGRVSAGKSSLLNAIVGRDVLPVGVTPVTAVPTRLEQGAEAGAEIRFLDGREERVALARLAEFVSEEGNPENRKGVLRAVARVSSPIFGEGIVFVDTPGIGALATSGARESYSYLPRCDLGVLLVAGGGTLEPDDLSVIQQLYDSAIPAAVLVSKADLLAEADKQRFAAYIRAKLRESLGIESMPIHFVSVVGNAANLATSWFESEIAPLVVRASELASASARRKLEHLRETVVAALRVRLGASSGERAPDSVTAAEVERLVREAHLALEQAREQFLDDLDPGPAVEETISAILAVPVGPERVRQAEATAAAVGEQFGARAGRIVSTARDRLRGVLELIATKKGRKTADAELKIDFIGRPKLALAASTISPGLDALRGAGFVTRFRWFVARKRAAQALAEPVGEEFRALARRLREWGWSALDKMGGELDSQLEVLRARSDGPRRGMADEEARRALLADLASLSPTATRNQPPSVNATPAAGE